MRTGIRRTTAPRRVWLAAVLAFSGLMIGSPHLLRAATLETTLSPPTVHVGDPISLTLTLRSAEGESFELPQAGEKLGDLDVLACDKGSPAKQDDGSIVQTITYQLAVYKVGKVQVPPVEIKQTGPAARVLASTPGEVDVTSVLSGQEKEIEDIKAPMSIPAEFPWFWVCHGLILLAAAGLIWWWMRRRRRAAAGEGTRTVEPLLSPEDEAIEALRRLDEAGYIMRGELKKHCILLSEILKHYVYRRYAVPVEERTTEEIIDSSQRKLPAAVFSLLQDFLLRADMVKFAKYAATPDEVREMMKWTLRLIEVSRPAVESPAEEAVSA